METALYGPLFSGTSFNFVYTLSDFYYFDFPLGGISYGGRRIPGLPRHNLFTEIFYAHHSGLYGRLEMQGTSNIYINDENSSQQNAYWLVNLQAGFQVKISSWRIEPFIGVNNLLGSDYADKKSACHDNVFLELPF